MAMGIKELNREMLQAPLGGQSERHLVAPSGNQQFVLGPKSINTLMYTLTFGHSEVILAGSMHCDDLGEGVRPFTPEEGLERECTTAVI